MSLFISTSGLAQFPIGNDAVRLVEDWPINRPGVLCRQVSSSDPQGQDADGTGFLYQEDSLFVIFDQEGPGCVYRIWIRGTASASSRTIKIYFDHETLPSISLPIGTLFSGLYQNFLSPLVGNSQSSAGGNYLYLPLPFARHLKIALVNVVLPYQISYQLYSSGTTIEPFTSAVPDSLISQWQNVGADPKSLAGNLQSSGVITLAPNQTQTIFTRSGSGSIAGMHLNVSPASLSTLEGIKLHATWDNAFAPQVDSPLGDFFGSSMGLAAVNGLPLGMDGQDLYCYIPMPFWSSAQLQLYNSLLSTSVNINYTIIYKTTAYPTDAGYFCANLICFDATNPGVDMTWAELSGHGQLAGVVVSLQGTNNLAFLHGDLRLYIDGIAAPLQQGTDFDGDFNAGNYFASGAFSRPVHGAPAVQFGSSEKKVCAYRFFLGDLVPFASSLTLRAEHGNRNSQALEYCCLTYSFKRPEVSLAMTDEIDVGDPISEQEHDYTVQGGQLQGTHYYAYPGTYDDQFFSDAGRVHFGVSAFQSAIAPNNLGVRLVRRRDASLFPQSAQVNVAGDSVGIWWDSDHNDFKRWDESVFEIPASYTMGQSQVIISLTSLSSSGWSEYDYKVYSHIPPQLDTQAPGTVASLNFDPPEDGSMMFLQWNQAVDNVGVSKYRIYRGASSGVQPTQDFLVGETPLTNFTDIHLMPGTWYYYRVSAVDFAGNQGGASAEFSQRTSSNYGLEFEDCHISASSANDTALVQNMINFGETWSAQEQLLFVSDAPGDFITLDFQLSQPDTYDVAGYFTKAPNYGILSVHLDDLPLGLPYDLYAPSVQRSPQIDLGTIALMSGAHRITLEVAGKNAASTDYRLGADNLLLASHYLLAAPGEITLLPHEFDLYPNFPNPFNASTRFRFSLPQAGWTTLSIFDVVGRQVARVYDGRLAAGEHVLNWTPRQLASGIYFVELKHSNQALIRKVILLK